jgi:hypothetical protein
MKAFEIKEALDALLSAGADGLYQVITLKSRIADAKAIFEQPIVTLRYTGGQFDKHSSNVNSPYTHNATFAIDIITAAKATVNLEILNNPDATDAERSDALLTSSAATAIADGKAHNVIDRIFDLIMRPQNRKLGLTFDPNRWTDSVKIDAPVKQGGIVIIPASITLSCTCSEPVTYETGTPATAVRSHIEVAR